MIDFFYQALADLGYPHPIHPIFVHLTIGLVTGAFIFGLLGLVFRRRTFPNSAYHCIVFALIAYIPTAIFGLMDWQHTYAGAWLFPIGMKILLGVILLVLLIIAVSMARNPEGKGLRIFIVYMLCFVAVMGLGYFGGDLVYGNRGAESDSEQPVDGKLLSGLSEQGAQIFASSCAGCHHTDSTEKKVGPGLLSLFERENLPASEKPATPENVRDQIRTPVKDMPAFSEDDLSPEQVDAVIDYLEII